MHIYGQSPFSPRTVAGEGRGLTVLLLNMHARLDFSTRSFTSRWNTDNVSPILDWDFFPGQVKTEVSS